MKVVINKRFGGFSLSREAVEYMANKEHPLAIKELEEAKKDGFYGYLHGLERTDPLLIEAVEILGDKANGECASLSVVEIPDDIEYDIEDYDGYEHIAERHRTWG